MPMWLAWLLPVPASLLGAVGWLAWSGRRRGPVHTHESIQAHERFQAALQAPVPAPRSAPPGRVRGRDRARR